jgi:hypothetical protein
MLIPAAFFLVLRSYEIGSTLLFGELLLFFSGWFYFDTGLMAGCVTFCDRRGFWPTHQDGEGRIGREGCLGGF